jgi:tellurite resistance protein TerC
MNQCGSLVRRGDKVAVTITSESRFFQPTTMSKFAWLRRTVVAVIGSTVLLIGLAMVVLPGPAVIVIPLGLAILATEFVWAKRILEKARATIARKGAREN